jgi:metal-responsive CopG/Arc/MetJ family transcriptional regulator
VYKQRVGQDGILRGGCPPPPEYHCLVRIKTSITLPKELLRRLDRVDTNRSALLERAALTYLAQLEREERDRRDIATIHRNSGRLNREAMDTLEYQQLS